MAARSASLVKYKVCASIWMEMHSHVMCALQAKLQAQRAQLKQNLMAEAMRECTFKPKTNEGQNRELIARILRAEDECSTTGIAA